MLTKLLLKYYIFRRDIVVKRLTKQGVRGNDLLDHPTIKHWQTRIADIIIPTPIREYNRGYQGAMDALKNETDKAKWAKYHYDIADRSLFDDCFTNGWMTACSDVFFEQTSRHIEESQL